MSLTTVTKADVTSKFQRNCKDTGSSEVQVALLSAKINALTEHLKVHPKDFHSRRGLIHMVSSRRTLMRYLQRRKPEMHDQLIQQLGLRRGNK